jgi:hypothetical protein
MNASRVCSGAIAFGDRYSNGITVAAFFGNPKAPSHAKNEAIPANGVTPLAVVCNLISPEPKSGLNLNVSFGGA